MPTRSTKYISTFHILEAWDSCLLEEPQLYIHMHTHISLLGVLKHNQSQLKGSLLHLLPHSRRWLLLFHADSAKSTIQINEDLEQLRLIFNKLMRPWKFTFLQSLDNVLNMSLLVTHPLLHAHPDCPSLLPPLLKLPPTVCSPLKPF